MQDWIAQDQFQQFNNSHGLGKNDAVRSLNDDTSSGTKGNLLQRSKNLTKLHQRWCSSYTLNSFFFSTIDGHSSLKVSKDIWNVRALGPSMLVSFFRRFTQQLPTSFNKNTVPYSKIHHPASWQDPWHGKGTEVLVDGVQGPGLACRENKAWPTDETACRLSMIEWHKVDDFPETNIQTWSSFMWRENKPHTNWILILDSQKTWQILDKTKQLLQSSSAQEILWEQNLDHPGCIVGYTVYDMVWYDDMMWLM